MSWANGRDRSRTVGSAPAPRRRTVGGSSPRPTHGSPITSRSEGRRSRPTRRCRVGCSTRSLSTATPPSRAEGPAPRASRETTAPPDAPAYPPVVSGREGWLYSGEDFSKPCEPVRPLPNTWLASIASPAWWRLQGRRFVFTVAPNKSTITPEFLPDEILGRRLLGIRQRKTSGEPCARTRPTTTSTSGRRSNASRRRTGCRSTSSSTPTGRLGPTACTRSSSPSALEPGLWEGSKIVEAGFHQSGGDLAAAARRGPHLPGGELEGRPARGRPRARTPGFSRGRRWRCRGGGARSGPRTVRGCGHGGRRASRAGPRWSPGSVRRWG